MSIFELFIIAVGLSMDAFAVAVCKGLSVYKLKPKHMLITGLWFGGFQGLMPLIGYLLGSTFDKYITPVDHWVAFVLLGIIGANMIKESISKDDECDCEDGGDNAFSVKTMFVMAIATSIDALAVGITFALLPDVNITAAVAFIAVITFALSCVGIKIGNVFGAKFKSKAEFAGGIILILMGTKILLEHLGVINF